MLLARRRVSRKVRLRNAKMSFLVLGALDAPGIARELLSRSRRLTQHSPLPHTLHCNPQERMVLTMRAGNPDLDWPIAPRDHHRLAVVWKLLVIDDDVSTRSSAKAVTKDPSQYLLENM